jgi:hypothetical protein
MPVQEHGSRRANATGRTQQIADRSRYRANTARPFFCLQEESGTAETGARKEDSVLLTADSYAIDKFSHYSAAKLPGKPHRLWKNACISTAANVQKPLFCS